MRLIRRVGGMAVAGVLLSGFVAGGASASTVSPETFVGSAAAQALVLSVGSSSLTSGVSAAKIDSTLKAHADASGLLGLPLAGGSNAGAVDVSGSGVNKVDNVCATPALPSAVATYLNVGAACSSSLAEITADGPHALGKGSVLSIDGNLQTILNQPISALQPVTDTLLGTLASINAALPVNLQPTDTLSSLLTALGNTQTLAVKLGDSTSETTTSGSVVTSVAKAEAGDIQILPLGATVNGTQLKPVVEIQIGSASATAVYDRATGKSTPAFDPAIATIRINTPTTDAAGALIGQDLSEIKIAPDLTPTQVVAVAGTTFAQPCADAANEYCLLPGTPFETRIAVASGRTVTNADGSVGAIADAVKIHALVNIGTLVPPLDGGIKLELSHAEAGVGGAPAVTQVAVPDVPRELPRTGGTPWIPLAGAAGLVAVLFGRRLFVRAR